MKKYIAKLRRDKWGMLGIPEILYPETGKEKNSPAQFRLANCARVKVGSYEGPWGRFAKGYYSEYFHRQMEPEFRHYISLDFSALDTGGEMSFEVMVAEGAWECDPEAILQRIDELEDKISRRNRQIKDLR